VTLPSPVECARWYEQASGQRAVVMIDPAAEGMPHDGVGRAMTVDALTTLRWISRPDAAAPRLLALAAQASATLVLHHGADAVTGRILVGPLADDDPPAADQLRALGLDATPSSDLDKGAVVAQDALASALAFAVVTESEAPGEEPDRPPAPDPDELPADIYASEFIGLATPFGAPLESVWHQMWELSGVRWCLLNADLEIEHVERIPYRHGLPAAEFVLALRACNEAGLSYLNLPVCVVTGPGQGHVVHLETVGDEETVYHDPWPGRSLLAAGNNEHGVAAQPSDGPQRRWIIPTSDLERVAYASLVQPAVWLRICGVATVVRYDDLSASEFFGFFHLSETGRTTDDKTGLVEIGLQPGNWQDRIALGATVDAEGRLRAATLMVDRSWLADPATAMFGADLLASFVGAVVTEADADEAELLQDALRGLPTGQVMQVLAGGPAHLLNHFRLVAMAAAGVAPFARATLPCSTIRVVNGTPQDEAETGSRLVTVVTRPERELGPLFDDQQSGYLMDDQRAFLWRKARQELQRLNIAVPGD
jgi:hypothetical protein